MHKHLTTTFASLIVLALALALAPASVRAADTYKVDPVHSSLVFKIKHLDTAYLWGRFNNLEGTVVADGDVPKSVEFSVNTESVDTGNAKRDAHLKSPDFFSAKEFPKITFKSNSVKPAGDNKFEVTGDLTLHGQTRPLTAVVERTGTSTQQGQKVGYYTSFTVKRSDFGMSGMIPMVGDEVELHLGTEVRKS